MVIATWALKLFEELFGTCARPRVHRELHVADLLVDIFHERDDEVDELVAVHELRMSICDQKTDIIVLFLLLLLHLGNLGKRLRSVLRVKKAYFTFTGLRLSMTKLSARIIMNRMNLWLSIFSSSSDFLMAMLMRIELTDVSMSTRSFSLRLITTGDSRSSLLFLYNSTWMARS